MKSGSQGWCVYWWCHYTLKDFSWLDVVKRYTGELWGPRWVLLFLHSVDRSSSRLINRGRGPVRGSPVDSYRWKLHRNHSPLDLSESSPFRQRYAWLLRLLYQIQIVSPCQSFWWAGKNFLSDAPTAISKSSFPSSIHSYLRSTSYKNLYPAKLMVVLPLWNPDDIFIYSFAGANPVLAERKPWPDSWMHSQFHFIWRKLISAPVSPGTTCFHKRMSHVLSAQVIISLSLIRSKSLKSLPDYLTPAGLPPNFY